MSSKAAAAAMLDLKPEVKVISSSGRSCPVKIEPSSPESWSVSYFTTCYPQGNHFEDHDAVIHAQEQVSAQPTGVQSRTTPYQLENAASRRPVQEVFAGASWIKMNNDSAAQAPVSKQQDAVNGTDQLPTITISVSINGIQARKSPFKLQFIETMAVGTKVQQKYGEKIGVVKSCRKSYIGVSVQWEHVSREKQHQVNDFKVFIE